MRSADDRFDYLNIDGKPLPRGTAPSMVHRFAFQCRTHPGIWCSVNLRGRGHDIDQQSWTWDGNVDHPTLHPSINCRGCWHGYIEGGIFNDCNHRPEDQQ